MLNNECVNTDIEHLEDKQSGEDVEVGNLRDQMGLYVNGTILKTLTLNILFNTMLMKMPILLWIRRMIVHSNPVN